MAAALFWISITLLFYVYLGYPVCLLLVRWIGKGKSDLRLQNEEFTPFVTSIIPVYNEEEHVESRIKNLLDCDYPLDRHEIIIASDGSSDRTVEIARKYASKMIQVVDFKQNRGRATVHNETIALARGEIIVFSDARTRFSKKFVSNIVRYFSESQTGCAISNLIYRSEGTGISSSESFYFGFENRLRSLESDLGLLATGCGPAMAIRKGIWRPLKSTDDCDFTTPIDAALQGYRIVFARDAVAFDTPPSSTIRGELRVRVRMTSKNLVGTLYRFGVRGWFRRPGIGWSLLSHKILRWFSPFFMLGAFLGNSLLLDSGFFYKLTFIGQLSFYLLSLCGWLGEMKKIRIPLISTAFAFCVANLGMGIGVIKGFMGKAPSTYKKEK